MKQGLFKNSAYIFTFLIAFALALSPEEEAKALEIKYDSNMFCVDNAVAPLNNLLDIQTFLSCNGFNPGPIDGQTGPKTKNAIISFQKESGLLADGIAGNKTKAAMRAYTGCKSENVCIARDNRSAKLDSVAEIQTYLANNGFNPGIIGTLIPSFSHKSTNSKYLLLSKNI